MEVLPLHAREFSAARLRVLLVQGSGRAAEPPVERRVESTAESPGAERASGIEDVIALTYEISEEAKSFMPPMSRILSIENQFPG